MATLTVTLAIYAMKAALGEGQAGGIRHGLALSLAIVLACALPSRAPAQDFADPSSVEQRLKAAYLYSFVGYVTWPPSAFPRPDTPVTIAVMGANRIAEHLEQTVAGRKVGDRAVIVKRLKPGDEPDDIHVLFLGKAEMPHVQHQTRTALARAVLTVTESDGALDEGSIINFVIAEQRVKFEVSLIAAEKSGLQLSAKLLAVAQRVLTDPQQ